jgi:hypothetical protein
MTGNPDFRTKLAKNPYSAVFPPQRSMARQKKNGPRSMREPFQARPGS